MDNEHVCLFVFVFYCLLPVTHAYKNVQELSLSYSVYLNHIPCCYTYFDPTTLIIRKVKKIHSHNNYLFSVQVVSENDFTKFGIAYEFYSKK